MARRVDEAANTPNITTAADGAAYALFDIASLLYERRAFDSAQIYGQLVQMLMPQSPYVLMMLGDIAALNENYPQAIAYYHKIPQTAALHWLSQMRVAEVYQSNGHNDRAINLLTDLSQQPQTRIQALITLGDIHRRAENFAQAVEVYDQALTGIDVLTEDHWPIIYARGMSLERANNWDRAEKDLLMALEFQPDNPMILNYIGYSWADKGVHLDKALDYIHRAVTLRPDDGYILDSYGWALYKTGDFEGAIEWLEKAVALVPGDATILDHLGDAYWQVGRRSEAQFQWKRAMMNTKDAAFKTSIDEKLTKGINIQVPTTLPEKQRSKEAKL